MRTFISLVFLVACSGLLFQPGAADTRPNNQEPVPVFVPELHTGDLVLRSGKGFISGMFRRTSVTEQLFSHAGMIIKGPNGYLVAHCISAQAGAVTGIRVEPLADFCDRLHNDAIAVYRYDCLEGKDDDVRRFILHAVQSGIAFDDQFRLDTDDRWYCSEFVYKILLRVGGTQLPLTRFNGNTYVGLDNLYLNPYAKRICSKKI